MLRFFSELLNHRRSICLKFEVCLFYGVALIKHPPVLSLSASTCLSCLCGQNAQLGEAPSVLWAQGSCQASISNIPPFCDLSTTAAFCQITVPGNANKHTHGCAPLRCAGHVTMVMWLPVYAAPAPINDWLNVLAACSRVQVCSCFQVLACI